MGDIFDEAAAGIPDAISGARSSVGDIYDQIGAQVQEPSTLDKIWGDVKGLGPALGNLVTSIPSGISNLVDLPKNAAGAVVDAAKLGTSKLFGTEYTPSGIADYPQLDRTVRGVGNLASGLLGPGGIYFYDKLNQLTGSDKPTTPLEDLAALRKNLVQFGVTAGATDLAGGAINLAGKGISNAVGPQTEAGAIAEVGKNLSPLVDRAKLTEGVQNASGDSLGAMRTSAEVAQSPELAVLEQQIGSGGDTATGYAKYQNETRPDARDFILNQVSDARAIPTENTGSAIQKIYGTAETASKKAMGDLYDAIPNTVKADVKPLRGAIDRATSKFFGEGAPNVPSEIQDRINFIEDASNDNGARIGALQRTRSHLLDIARDAPGTQKGALASIIADKIKETLANAPEGSQEWRAANAAAKAHYDLYGQDSPLGNLNDVHGSQVVDKIFARPESAAHFMKVLGEDPQATELVKDQIASDLGKLDPAAQARFIDQNASELKSLLKDDYSYVESLRNDIRSKIDTGKLANATQGSNTALKLSNVVERALTGKNSAKPVGAWSKIFGATGLGSGFYYGTSHPLVALPLAAAGVGVKLLRDRSAGLVQDALTSSLMHPKNLLEALKAADAANVPGLASSIFSAAPPVVAGAVTGLNNSAEPSSIFGGPSVDLFGGKNMSTEAPQKQDIALIEKQIDANPYYSALYETESGRNPSAHNRNSSAKGGFQFIDSTARALKLDNPLDLAKSFDAVKTLTDENMIKFGDDPVLLYAAHYLGESVLRKVLNKKPLSDSEEATYQSFITPSAKGKLSPKDRFLSIYSRIAGNTTA